MTIRPPAEDRDVDLDGPIAPAPFGIEGVLRNILTLSFAAYLIPFCTVFLLTLVPPTLPFRGVRVRWSGWWNRLFLKVMQTMFGIRVVVEGLEHVDEGQAYVIAANHRSWLDIVCLVVALEPKIRPVFMLKNTLLWIPVFGPMMRAEGHIPVKRGQRAPGGQRARIAQAIAHVRRGSSLVVFPEGTRAPHHRFLKFRRGAFEVASAASVPLLPVTISGTARLFPRGTPLMRPGEVRMTVHPPTPVSPDEVPQPIAQSIRRRIAEAYRLDVDGPPAVDVPGRVDALLADRDGTDDADRGLQSR